MLRMLPSRESIVAPVDVSGLDASPARVRAPGHCRGWSFGVSRSLHRRSRSRPKLVEDSGGFRTFVSRVPGSNILALRGQAIVNEHIGRLYSAFLNTTSTLDWVRYLVEVEELPVRSGRWQHGGGVGGAGESGWRLSTHGAPPRLGHRIV